MPPPGGLASASVTTLCRPAERRTESRAVHHPRTGRTTVGLRRFRTNSGTRSDDVATGWEGDRGPSLSNLRRPHHSPPGALTSQSLRRAYGSLGMTLQSLHRAYGSLEMTSQSLRRAYGSLEMTCRSLRTAPGSLEMTCRSLRTASGSLEMTCRSLRTAPRSPEVGSRCPRTKVSEKRDHFPLAFSGRVM